MKKILYIVSTLKRGGPANQLYNILKYLDRNEFEPYLITLSPEPEDSRWTDYKALGVYLYSLGLSRLQGFLYATKRIKSLFSEIKPDVIHSQGIRGDIISSKIKMDIPKLATIRNLPQFDYIMTYSRIAGWLMCIRHIRALKKILCCIGVSEAVKDNLINKYKINNTVAIQNGVDTEIYFSPDDTQKKQLREKLKLPLSGNIFISSGHLSERKDPLFLIKSWKKKFDVQSNNHLIFIGSGNLQEKCIKESRGHKNIHIVGRVNNVVDYLKSGDYFISASQTEGLPNAVLEAMACGLPVLLSDIEPHKEILTFAPNVGFCYELSNEVSFSLMLDKIMNMDKAAMSQASLDAVNKYFCAQKMSDEYQNRYRQLCSGAI